MAVDGLGEVEMDGKLQLSEIHERFKCLNFRFESRMVDWAAVCWACSELGSARADSS